MSSSGAGPGALVTELIAGLRAFAIPMRTRFRGVTVREGALIHGPAGWGEFSPFAEYGPAECARWLACAIESAVEGWPPPRRESIPVNVTVPAVGPQQAHAIAAGSGATTAKVKVAERGQAPADDIARVEAVRDALGPGGKIRVDANGAWQVDEAERMLRELGRFGLEYAEQPCATLDELARLRRRVDVPLAADETAPRAAPAQSARRRAPAQAPRPPSSLRPHCAPTLRPQPPAGSFPQRPALSGNRRSGRARREGA
ncbi:MAG: enolase C-terminal domain-like protein [Micromonosporaceae bacterium]